MGWFKDVLKKGAGIVGAAAGFALGGPAGAAAGFALGSSVSGSIAEFDAAKEEKRAQRAQRRAQQLTEQQRRLDMLRNMQRAEASAIVNAVASGASIESSGAQAVQSNIGAQTATNLRLQGVGVALSTDYYNRLRNAAKSRGQAQVFNTLGNLASAGASFLPGASTPLSVGGVDVSGHAAQSSDAGLGGVITTPGYKGP